MKEVYDYQEIGTLIDQGRRVIFTCHPEVRVSCMQKQPDSEVISVTLMVEIGDTCVGIIENQYPSMHILLEAFAIDDLSEIWEVLE